MVGVGQPNARENVWAEFFACIFGSQIVNAVSRTVGFDEAAAQQGLKSGVIRACDG